MIPCHPVSDCIVIENVVTYKSNRFSFCLQSAFNQSNFCVFWSICIVWSLFTNLFQRIIVKTSLVYT